MSEQDGDSGLPPSTFGAGYRAGGSDAVPPAYGGYPNTMPPFENPPPVPGYPGYMSPAPTGQYPMPPQYPAPYPAAAMPGGYPSAPKTNGLAIASLVCSILGLFCCFTALPGVILGHMATSQIKRTGEDGKGLAVAGLVVGYLGMGIVVLVLLLALVFPAIAIMIGLSEAPTSTPTYSG